MQHDLVESDVGVLVRAALEGRALEKHRKEGALPVGKHKQKEVVAVCYWEVVACCREPVKQAERGKERQKLSCMLETLGLYDHTTLVPHRKG